MRISRATNNGAHLLQLVAYGMVCSAITSRLWSTEAWLASGWHRAISYVIAGAIGTVVFLLPTFWLRRRFLRVEEERPTSA